MSGSDKCCEYESGYEVLQMGDYYSINSLEKQLMPIWGI
jgi:hypothetical protein